jgi:enoyl-CoA hydratase
MRRRAQFKAGGVLMSLAGAALTLENLLYEKKGAIKFALEAVNRGLETSQSEGLSMEASLFGLCAGTEDKKEGTQAFLQKRAPQFQGR